jgi:hypothetical protein
LAAPAFLCAATKGNEGIAPFKNSCCFAVRLQYLWQPVLFSGFSNYFVPGIYHP